MKFAITSFSTSTKPSVSADSFCFVYNYNSGYSGTDAATKVTTQTRMRISNLFASVSVAAGTSASWTITLRKNGADTALATTISGASQVENTNSSDVITFKRLKESLHIEGTVNGEEIVDKTLKKLLRNSPHVTTSRLYEALIPEIIKDQAYYDSDGKLLDIDKYIAKRYQYKLQEDGQYGWSV